MDHPFLPQDGVGFQGINKKHLLKIIIINRIQDLKRMMTFYMSSGIKVSWNFKGVSSKYIFQV